MKNVKMFLIGIVSTALVGTTVVFGVNSIQNKAIRLEEQIKVANSDIGVQEKRRVDLIYNLVDTVKQYDKHEAETLKEIVEARSKDGGSVGDVTTMIGAVTEDYPELKSNENYKQLMNELSLTENIIAQHRSNYNIQVKEYNRYTRKFPNSSLLNMLGYERVEYDYLEYDAPADAPQNLFGE